RNGSDGVQDAKSAERGDDRTLFRQRARWRNLEEAVKMMGRHQLGLELEERQALDIVSWLRSLTGVIPKDYIARPELP
ncbi:MAG: hypothetical protein B0A82_23750, partial [Alkalinema sp. CACIAM 70d]